MSYEQEFAKEFEVWVTQIMINDMWRYKESQKFTKKTNERQRCQRFATKAA